MNRIFFHYILLLAIISLGLIQSGQAQRLQSPEAFLGYAPGERFAYHHEVMQYVRHLAQSSSRVKMFTYGKSYEGRDLVATVISSEANLENLEEIRTSHLARISLGSGEVTAPARPIVWLSYNVHGNEAACTEAALSTLYGLAAASGDTAQWLDKLVIILDPCLNPDGRERYVQNYRQRAAPFGNADPNAWEHVEPWPTGRFNHYLFDPNRDWCWQSQQESQQRLALFRQWMPHIHADFHEMGHNSSYFFAPAAKPYHEVITPWQRRFQEICGEHHAHYFNQNKWRYFTGETYDLFYPSYGDTWPMFSGAIGFTYEQGGSGKAGTRIHRGGNDTLKLLDRIAHHVVTGFSTVEIAFKEREKLLQKQIDFFKQPTTHPPGPYRSFVFKTQHNPEAITALTSLLDNQLIRYTFAEEGYGPMRQEGLSFERRNVESFRVAEGDLIISTAQPQGRLVKVLFEPEAYLEDSLTYDLTAWALPYAFGLKGYALSNVLPPGEGLRRIPDSSATIKKPYAFLLPWYDTNHAKMLAEALRKGMKVRYSTARSEVNERVYEPGTLAFLAGENEQYFSETMLKLAESHGVSLVAIPTGRIARGSDLGSENWKDIKAPKVALITGEGTRPTSVGELWFHFEQTLQYPVSLISTQQLKGVWLNKYDLVILPDGDFSDYEKSLKNYIKEGGKVMALQGAVATFLNEEEPTKLAEANKALQDKSKAEVSEKPSNSLFGGRGRASLSSRVAGSIYRIHIDRTHVLAYGYSDAFYLIKNNSNPIPMLPTDERTVNVGMIGEQDHVSGFSGQYAKARLENSLAIGVESYGEGKLVYMSDSPIFRGFWRNGELLLANVIFFL